MSQMRIALNHSALGNGEASSGHSTAALTTEAGTRAESDGWIEVGRKEDGQIIFQKSPLGFSAAQLCPD